MPNKTKDILKSIVSSNRSPRPRGGPAGQMPIIVSGGNQIQQKAISKIACKMDDLVNATASGGGMDVIPEIPYVDLTSQIAATPNNGVTKNTNTSDVVFKDLAGDYITILGAPGSSRFSNTFSFTANIPLIITHNLGVEDVVVFVKDDITKEVVSVEIRTIDALNVEVTSTTTVDLIVTCV